MTRQMDGWRTAQSYQRVLAAQRLAAGEPEPLLALPAPDVVLGEATIAPPRRRGTPVVAVLVQKLTEPLTPPLWAVEWSPILVAFLIYLFAVTTYRIPGAVFAMSAAVVTLFFQRARLRIPVFLVLLALLVGWYAVGLMNTAFPPIVHDAVVADAKLILIVLVAVNALRTPAQIRLYTVFFLGCYALYPFRGALYNYYIVKYATFGRAIWNFIYSNPNDLAALTLLQLSMAAALLAGEQRRSIRMAALAGVIGLPALILLTQSRGAILALGVFALLTFAAQQRKGRALIYATVLGLIVASAAPDSVWERIRGMRNLTKTSSLEQVDSEGSAVQRFEIWKIARKMIRDNPVTGVGLGTYSLMHERYFLSGGFLETAHGRRDTHSTYLNLAAETGIPGLLLFLTVFGTVLWRAEKTRRRCRETLPRLAQQILYLELGIVAFFTAGLFGSFAHLSFTYLHLSLIWVMAESASEQLAKASSDGSATSESRWRAVRPMVRDFRSQRREGEE